MLAAGTKNVGNANAVTNFGIADSATQMDTTIARLDEYLNNLAAAAMTERTMLQKLVDANTSLTTSVAALTAAYTLLAAGHAPNAWAPATNQPTQDSRSRCKLLDPNGYCWSHGYKVAIGHTSATCTTKCDGHQDGATWANTMGSSTTGKPT
jgi:hypothetical protein